MRIVTEKLKSKISLDFWLIAISTTVSILLSVLLVKYEKWMLEPRIRAEETREIVGQATAARNNPQRRYSGSLTYLDLKAGENINLGDTIFVDSNSSLELKLSTGSTIRLGAMTLVLVDRENNLIKLVLNNGEVEGTIYEKDKVILDINEENLELSGEKNAVFKISKADITQSTVFGKKGRLQMHFREQTQDITNKKVNLNDPNSNAQPSNPPVAKTLPSADRVPAKSVPTEIVSLDDVPIDLPIPYPSNKQLFLLKKNASIMIMPKRQCTEDCNLILFKNGVEVGHWKFLKQTPPLIKLPFSVNEAGHYSVKLHDQSDLETEFDIQQFSAHTFENAIKSGISVELLD